jgi:hypothetical protein
MEGNEFQEITEHFKKSKIFQEIGFDPYWGECDEYLAILKITFYKQEGN